jgi:hypothetical protein
MRCHVDKWEEERIDSYNEQCFADAVEELFDEDDLEFYGPDDILWEIEDLQKRYHMFVESGYDMAEVLEIPDDMILLDYEHYFWMNDVTDENLFVTKHRTHRRKERTGKRVMGKQDGPLNVECLIICV